MNILKSAFNGIKGYFDNNYHIHPFSGNLGSTEKKILALIASIVIFPFTLGVPHLVAFVREKITERESRTNQVAQNTLNPNEVVEIEQSSTEEGSFSFELVTDLHQHILDDLIFNPEVLIDCALTHCFLNESLELEMVFTGENLERIDAWFSILCPEEDHWSLAREGKIVITLPYHLLKKHLTEKNFFSIAEQSPQLLEMPDIEEVRIPFLDVDTKKATRILLDCGKAPGDYVITCSKTNKRKYQIQYLDENLNVKIRELLDPNTVRGGGSLDVDYPHLKRAVGFTTAQENIIAHQKIRYIEGHELLKCLHNRTLSLFYKPIQTNDFANTVITLNALPGIGLRRFMEWINESTLLKDQRFRPGYLVKVIGHHFGLKGLINCPDPDKSQSSFHGGFAFQKETVELEGTSSILALGEIAESVLQFLPQAEVSLEHKIKLKEMVKQSLKTQNTETIRESLEEGIPITISTGWEGHAVNITLTKNFLTITNKGDRSAAFGGTKLYKIHDPSNLKTFLQKMYQGGGPLSKAEMEAFLETDMVNLLKLEHLKDIEGKDQKVGNCSFANNKACLKNGELMLTLEDWLEEGQEIDSNSDAFEALRVRTKELHDSFALTTRLYWLDSLLTLLQTCDWDPAFEKRLLFIAFLTLNKLKNKNLDNTEIQRVKNDYIAWLNDSENDLATFFEFVSNTYGNKYVFYLFEKFEEIENEDIHFYLSQPFIFNPLLNELKRVIGAVKYPHLPDYQMSLGEFLYFCKYKKDKGIENPVEVTLEEMGVKTIKKEFRNPIFSQVLLEMFS